MNFSPNWLLPVFISAILSQTHALAWDYLDPQTGQQFEISKESENTYLFVSADCHGCYTALSRLSTCDSENLKNLKIISFDGQEKSEKLWLRAGPQAQKFVINRNRSSKIKRKHQVNGTPYFVGPKKSGLGSPDCKDLKI